MQSSPGAAARTAGGELAQSAALADAVAAVVPRKMWRTHRAAPVRRDDLC